MKFLILVKSVCCVSATDTCSAWHVNLITVSNFGV